MKTPGVNEHSFRAAEGWLELGNVSEAKQELATASPSSEAAPHVLALRWHLYSKAGEWDRAFVVAEALARAVPRTAQHWVNVAEAVRKKPGGSALAAWEILLSVADVFDHDPLLPLTLTALACELGRAAEAKSWLAVGLELALKIGQAEKWARWAIEQPELTPLCPDIQEWLRAYAEKPRQLPAADA